MNRRTDANRIERLAAAQGGVFSKADLQTLLAEPHPSAFGRRIRALEEDRVLRRFVRGWYVTEAFDLPTMSQRLAPRSYVSFDTVLARELLVGPRPERRVMAAKVGRGRIYRGLGYELVHVHIAPHIDFGHAPSNGVQYADPEKAVLDVLYFHLRGRRFPFDVYSDIAYRELDRRRLEAYLKRFRNPKFVAFATRILELG